MGIRHQQHRSNLMSVASDRRILSLLVRARMSLRRQRREGSFYHRLAKTGQNPRTGLETELSALFPPRREWPRPGFGARRSAADRGLDPVSITLVEWLLSNFSKPNSESPDWLRRLRRFTGSVRTRIRNWDPDTSFEKPKIYAVLKSRAPKSGQADSFRCLAMYNLRDRIVISIAARYLREISDGVMHPGSLAFRTKVPIPTHHDAVERIMRFREDHSGIPLWISEVDIRGFFDVVNHKVARIAVRDLLAKLPEDQCVDARALSILDAYFASYSFNKIGQREAQMHARKRQRRGYEVEVPWPVNELRELGVDIESDLVGIPQGGALSCFLANAILHEADRAVQRAVSSEHVLGQEGLYLRYCDDIICLATSRTTSKRMVDAYGSALRKLKLPAHKSLDFNRLYDGSRERQRDGFWKSKSKEPYEWGPADKPGRVPWCAFVGYHVRYDGVLRIRPSSIKKEIEKHNHILRQVGRFLRRRGQARSKKQILYRFRQRLRCIAVGTGAVGAGLDPPPFSWTQGFRLLRTNPSLSGQLRDLDRHRVACVRTLSRNLKRHGTGDDPARQHDGLAFEGFPFSYAGLVERSSHPRRIRTNTSGVEGDKTRKVSRSRKFEDSWTSVSSRIRRKLSSQAILWLILLVLGGYLLLSLFA